MLQHTLRILQQRRLLANRASSSTQGGDASAKDDLYRALTRAADAHTEKTMLEIDLLRQQLIGGQIVYLDDEQPSTSSKHD